MYYLYIESLQNKYTETLVTLLTLVKNNSL